MHFRRLAMGQANAGGFHFLPRLKFSVVFRQSI